MTGRAAARLGRRYAPLLGLLLIQVVAAVLVPSRAPAPSRAPDLDPPAAAPAPPP